MTQITNRAQRQTTDVDLVRPDSSGENEPDWTSKTGEPTAGGRRRASVTSERAGRRSDAGATTPAADPTADEFTRVDDGPGDFRALLDRVLARSSTDSDDVTSLVKERLSALAGDRQAFDSFLTSVYGERVDAAAADRLFRQIGSGDFSFLPEVRLVGRDVLGAAKGAYDADAGVVYLHRDLTAGEAAETYAEELGHHLDTLLTRGDTQGDEGEIFRRVLSGEELTSEELARLRAEDDHGEIVVDGHTVAVEFDGDADDKPPPTRLTAPNGQVYLKETDGPAYAVNDSGAYILDRDAEGNDVRVEIDPATGLVAGATVQTLDYADGSKFYYVESAATGNLLATDANGKLKTSGNRPMVVDPSSIAGNLEVTLGNGKLGTLEAAAAELARTLAAGPPTEGLDQEELERIARGAILAVGDEAAGEVGDGIFGKVNLKLDLPKLRTHFARAAGEAIGNRAGKEIGMGDQLGGLFSKMFENLADPARSPLEGAGPELNALTVAATRHMASAGVPADVAVLASQAVGKLVTVSSRKAIADFNKMFGTRIPDDAVGQLAGAAGKALGDLVADQLKVTGPQKKAIANGFKAGAQHVLGYGKEELVVEEGWDDVGRSSALTIETITLVVDGAEKTGEALVNALLLKIFDGVIPDDMPSIVVDLVRTAIVQAAGSTIDDQLSDLFDVEKDLFKEMKADISGAFGHYIGQRLSADFGDSFSGAVGKFYQTMFRNVALGQDPYTDIDKTIVETMVQELVNRVGGLLPDGHAADILSRGVGSVLGTFASAALDDYANTFSNANLKLAGQNAAASIGGVVGGIIGKELAKYFPEEARPLIETAAAEAAKKAVTYFVGKPAAPTGSEAPSSAFQTAGAVLAVAVQFALGGKEIADGNTGAGVGRISGAAIGAAVGSAFPGVGTAIGAAVGALIGNLAGSKADGAKLREDLAEALAEQLGSGILEHQQSSFVAGRNLGAIMARVLQTEDGDFSTLLDDMIAGLDETLNPAMKALTTDSVMELDERTRDELFDAAYTQLWTDRDPKATDNKVAYLLLREAGEFTGAGLLSALKEGRSKGQPPPIITVPTDKPQTQAPTGPTQAELPTYEHTGIHADIADRLDAADGQFDGRITLIDTTNGNIFTDRELRDRAKAQAQAALDRLYAEAEATEGPATRVSIEGYMRDKFVALFNAAAQMAAWEVEHKDGLNDGFLDLKYLSGAELTSFLNRVGRFTRSRYEPSKTEVEFSVEIPKSGENGVTQEAEQQRLNAFNANPHSGLIAWIGGPGTVYFDLRTMQVVTVEIGMQHGADVRYDAASDAGSADAE